MSNTPDLFCIDIAGLTIEINALWESTKEFCADYITDDKPDFSVTICQEDIDYEREKSAREDEYEGIAVRRFPDAYLETLGVYRQIAERLHEFDAFLFHGSALAADGQGVLFTASSGTGKSTHASLWCQAFGERICMINDDKPILRFENGKLFAYGTPWNGKHRIGSNIRAPLAAMCILKRGENNRIERMDALKAYPMLLQQSYRPRSNAGMQHTLMLLNQMLESVPIYELHCNTDIEAAYVAYNGIKGGLNA